MKTLSSFCALLMALIIPACKQQPKTAEVPDPKVDGQKITMAENAPQTAALVTEPVEPLKQTSMSFPGRLVWNDDSTVRVFSPVAGRVAKIIANIGDVVRSGDALAEITSPDFDQAQADARKAEVDVELSQRTLNRTKELYEHGAAAHKDVEAAEADYNRAVAEKDRAATHLSFLGWSENGDQRFFILKAPLAGTVVEKNINPGLEVRPDAMMANVPQYAQPLFTISDPKILWLLLDVAESDLPLLKPGQKLRVQPRAFPDKIVEGKVEVIGDALDPNTRTVKVRAVVDNSERLLKAEMYVTAQIMMATETNPMAVDVSAKAVFLQDNEYFVFVQNAPGQFERRPVKVAGDPHEGRVAVTGGLHAGEKVVTDGSLLLQELLNGTSS